MIRPRDHSPDESASGRASKRQNTGRQNGTGDNDYKYHVPGFIRSVECVNFMCHKNLKIEVGPGITFVSGQNGHGKSAILTALIQVFSTSAAMRAERGNLNALRRTVRDNVKARSAKIIVRINNKNAIDELDVYAARAADPVGEKAYSLPPYQPETYGDCIIVEKEIFEKSSKLRIMAADGTIVSEKPNALKPIMSHFGYQFDNRLTVQTQENAKKRGDPRVLYDFFWNGSGFEGICDNLDKMDKTVVEQKQYLKDIIEPVLATKKVHRDKLHEELKRLEQSRHLYEDEAKYSSMLRWHEYKAVEREFEPLLVKMSKSSTKLQERKMKVEHRIETARVCEEELKAMPSSDSALDDQLRDVRSKITRTEYATRSTDREISIFKSDMKEIESGIQGLENDIEELRAKRSQADSSDKRERLDAEIQGLTKQVETAKQRHAASEEENTDKLFLEDEARRLYHLVQAKFNAIDKECNTAEQEIRTLVQAKTSKNPIAQFGSDCVEMDKIISENAGRFQERPLGPLAQYIRYNDKPNQTQSKHINYLVNPYMKAFLVTSQRDEKLLRELSSRARGCSKIAIYTVKPERFDLASISPDKKFLTVMDCLDFSEEPVRQCLIDWASINAVGLWEKSIEAIDLLQKRPPNLDVLICPHSNNPSLFTSVRQFGTGVSNLKLPTYGLISKGTPIASDERIAELTQHKQKLELDKAVLGSEVAEMTRKTEKATHDHREAGKIENQCKNDLVKLTRALEDKTYERESIPDDLSSDDTELAIRNKRVEIDSMRVQLQASMSDLKESEASKQEERNSLQSLNAEKEQLETRKIQQGDALAAKQAELDFMRNMVTQGKDKLKLLEDKLQDLEDEVAIKKKRLLETGTRARELDEKEVPLDDGVELEKASDYINDKLKRVKILIAADKASNSNSYTDVLTAYQAAELKVHEEEEHVIQQLSDLRALEDTAIHRRYTSNIALQLSTMHLKESFRKALKSKGATAELNIDTDNRRLEVLNYNEASSNSGKKGRDVTTVSGGEHSFVQSSIMSSMWNLVSTPLLCLDEYEVFMDDASRVTTQKRLISTISNRREKTQAILISPTVVKTGTGDDPMFVYVEVKDPAFNI